VGAVSLAASPRSASPQALYLAFLLARETRKQAQGLATCRAGGLDETETDVVVLILTYASVRPEPVEGRLPFANRITSAQSPRIMASFFFQLQPFMRRSQANASSRVVNVSVYTKVIGRL
jgi:hypothetical protein